jgi:DnaK suppressor protein
MGCETIVRRKPINQGFSIMNASSIRSLLRILTNQREREMSHLAEAAEVAECAGEDPSDEMDVASASSTADLNASLNAHRDARLTAIDEAIAGLTKGTYGWCRECGAEIGFARLSVLPFAIYCIDCQQDREDESALYCMKPDSLERLEPGDSSAAEAETEIADEEDFRNGRTPFKIGGRVVRPDRKRGTKTRSARRKSGHRPHTGGGTNGENKHTAH